MKYILSAIFVIGGLLVLGYGEQYHKIENQDSTESLNSINVQIDLGVFNERIGRLALLKDSVDKRILPLIILSPNVCFSCISNVVEYIELLKENSSFQEPTLIFIDQDKEKVERFLLTTDLNIPFELLKAQDLDPALSVMKKNLIFVDLHEQEVFYNIELSSFVTGLIRKEKAIHDVLSVLE